MGRILTVQEARAFYDRFGVRQDRQGFYENPALEDLIAHGRFETAAAVFEFGCGTGRLAHQLLRDQLPTSARYMGVDLSATMTGLASSRLRSWPDRAVVRQTEGSMKLNVPGRSVDRFVSTYVLDLLTEADIRVLMNEARRILIPGGLLCLVSLTVGRTGVARLITLVWRAVHAIHSPLLGGCRPIRLTRFLSADRWRIDYHNVVTAWGISSEVLVAASGSSRGGSEGGAIPR